MTDDEIKKVILWQETLLPIIQEINDYGGGSSVFQFSRAVFEEIDNGAKAGDKTLLDKKKAILHAANSGKWPNDPLALSSIFNTYHEALFYLLALRRKVNLENIPETSTPTPDFYCKSTNENFEIKTLDYSGGASTHKLQMIEGLDKKIEAADKAKTSGVGTSISTISPHGNAKNIKEVVQKVILQIANNVKSGQFADKPTTLVVALTRTAIRSRSEELQSMYPCARTNDPVSGHLWTIAAHTSFSDFSDIYEDSYEPRAITLESEGILISFPFIRGIIFLCTEWNEIDSRDSLELTTLDRAFKLFGIWNSAYKPVNPSSNHQSSVTQSEFHRLCDAYKVL